MGYNLNPPSSLRTVSQGRTFCVGVAEVMVGTTIGVFELRGAEWISVWLEPPSMDPELQGIIASEGGVRKFLERLAASINRALRELLGSAPPPVAAGVSATANLINEINAFWTLTTGPDGIPVFRLK